MREIFIGKCDVCKEDKPIVLVCLIGCHLCADCQEIQKRISIDELTAETTRCFTEYLSL